MKRIFLDDWRLPIDCATYMYRKGVDCRIYHEDWIILRSHGQFIKWIETNGLPNMISFDYDLTDVFELKEELPIEEWFCLEENRDYKGTDCANWLVEYCKLKNLLLPDYIIHSVNVDGCDEIKKILNFNDNN